MEPTAIITRGYIGCIDEPLSLISRGYLCTVEEIIVRGWLDIIRFTLDITTKQEFDLER